VRLEHSLVLNRYFHQRLGARSLEGLKQLLTRAEEGPGPNGQSRFFHAIAGRTGPAVSRPCRGAGRRWELGLGRLSGRTRRRWPDRRPCNQCRWSDDPRVSRGCRELNMVGSIRYQGSNGPDDWRVTR
jgi:hypothetical protein